MRRAMVGGLLLGVLCGFTPAGKAELDASYAEARELGIAGLFDAAPGLEPAMRRRAAAAVVREARALGIDPLLVAGVIQVESSFRWKAVSPVGARGLMQVMPATGAWFGARIGAPVRSPDELFDPERNIHIGVRYLGWLLKRFKRVDHALVAYNAGPARAARVLEGPTASEWLGNYPRKVLRAQRRYRAQLVPPNPVPPPPRPGVSAGPRARWTEATRAGRWR
jgi:soluble lytic murein transglycosylase-like protein